MTDVEAKAREVARDLVAWLLRVPDPEEYQTVLNALMAYGAVVRKAALLEAAEVADAWVEHYPTDVFPPDGKSVDALSATALRAVLPNVAAAIRKLAEEA